MKPNVEWLLTGSDQARGLPMNDRILVDDDQWRASIERIQIDRDLRLFLTDVEARREVTLEPRSDRDDLWIASQLTIAGRALMVFPDGQQAQATTRQALIFRSPEGRARYELSAGTRFRSLGYSIGIERVARLLDGRAPKVMEGLLGRHATAPVVVAMRSDQVMRDVVSNLFRERLNGPLRMLMMEGGIMQLIALQVAMVSQSAEAPSLRPLSIRERRVIVEARDCLLADMRRPPTLGELTDRFGMSEKRLNAGFRILFDMTAFELLRNERLAHAREALQHAEASVEEIAIRVGYNHVTNFISAFRARYGATPRHYLHQNRPSANGAAARRRLPSRTKADLPTE